MLFLCCLVSKTWEGGEGEEWDGGRKLKINYIIFFKDIYKNEKGKINISGY